MNEAVVDIAPIVEEVVKRKFKYNKSGLIWPAGKEGGIPPGGSYTTQSGRKYVVDENGCHWRAK